MEGRRDEGGRARDRKGEERWRGGEMREARGGEERWGVEEFGESAGARGVGSRQRKREEERKDVRSLQDQPLNGRNIAYKKAGEHPLPRHFFGEIAKQGQNLIPNSEEESIRCNRDVRRTGALIPSPATRAVGVWGGGPGVGRLASHLKRHPPVEDAELAIFGSKQVAGMRVAV